LRAQLNKEKAQRRGWASHNQQQEIFDVTSTEFKQLNSLKDRLEDVCAEPSRTGKTEFAAPPSRRKQLKTLRDEMRATVAHIDAKLAEPDSSSGDPELKAAREAAMERQKLPMHLRGSLLLSMTIGDGRSG
jgi:hypothetical protein